MAASDSIEASLMDASSARGLYRADRDTNTIQKVCHRERWWFLYQLLHDAQLGSRLYYFRNSMSLVLAFSSVRCAYMRLSQAFSAPVP